LVYVDKGQFSLAIGKRGNNVRLTSKLLGWRVDIEALEKDVLPVSATSSSEENVDLPVGADPLDIPLDSIEGLSKKVKEFLMEAGYSSLAQLKNINSDELYAIPGVGKTSAEEIMEHIKKATKHYKNM
jgi:N utilization substance protein A